MLTSGMSIYVRVVPCSRHLESQGSLGNKSFSPDVLIGFRNVATQ